MNRILIESTKIRIKGKIIDGDDVEVERLILGTDGQIVKATIHSKKPNVSYMVDADILSLEIETVGEDV